MVTQKTLRRKLRKKLKRKPYRRCECGQERVILRLVDVTSRGTYKVFKVCGGSSGCGRVQELRMKQGSSGVTGRHIPP